MAYVVSFILTIVYSLRMKKVFKKVKINLECNDKRCIFAVLFNQNTWRQPQDVNQGVKEEKSSKKIKINFADKKKVLTFATRFGKTEVWNKRRVFITRKFWKFIEKTEEVQASTEKTSKIEKSRSVSSFEELKCQESA